MKTLAFLFLFLVVVFCVRELFKGCVKRRRPSGR